MHVVFLLMIKVCILNASVFSAAKQMIFAHFFVPLR